MKFGPVVLVFVLMLSGSFALYKEIFCGLQTCYGVLGLTKDASIDDIRKVYRNMQREFHPDKAKLTNTHTTHESLEKQFHLIRTAYEILKDPKTRKEYDYLLMNPLAMHSYWHHHHGSKKRIQAQAGSLVAIVGVLAAVSVAQYFMANARYEQAIDNQLKSPVVFKYYYDMAKKRPVELPTDPTELTSVLKKDFGNCIAKTIFVARMSLDEVLLVRLFMLPVTIPRWLLFNLRWYYNRKIAKVSYTKDEKEYLSRKALGISCRVWKKLPPTRKKDLICHKLWIPENLDAYLNNTR